MAIVIFFPMKATINLSKFVTCLTRQSFLPSKFALYRYNYLIFQTFNPQGLKMVTYVVFTTVKLAKDVQNLLTLKWPSP